MARCPKCDHALSAEELAVLRCPACGFDLTVEEEPPTDPLPYGDDAGVTFDARDLSPEEMRRMNHMWGGAFDENTGPGVTIKSLIVEVPDQSFTGSRSGDQATPTSTAGPAGGVTGMTDSATGGGSQTAASDPSQGGNETDWHSDSVDETFTSDDFLSAEDSVTEKFEAPQPDAPVAPDADTPAQDDDADKDWTADSFSETVASDDDFSELAEGDEDSIRTIGSEEFAADSSGSAEGQPEGDGSDSYDQTVISDEFMPVAGDTIGDGGAWDADSVEKTFSSDEFVDESSETQDTYEAPSSEADSEHDSFDQTVISDSSLLEDSGSNEPDVTIAESQLLGSSGRESSYDQTIISDEFGSDSGPTYDSSEDPARTDEVTIAGGQPLSTGGLVVKRRMLRFAGTQGSEDADYELLSLLGEGGMGRVFNARQTAIDRSVAVKMLKVKSKKLREQQMKFLTEAVLTGDLAHPNIVPIYDVGRDEEDALFYAMKHVTGNPWVDTIQQKSLHENLQILLSVADAVAFAHSKGIVHRDLKPENVMLGEFGEVLVMDWGLAMPTHEYGDKRGITKTNSMGGTPAYMAPEMATGPLKKIGSWSDVYLLGAMLYEIVTGAPPHRGKNAMKCLMAAAKNEIHPTDKGGELIAIAQRAMASNPSDRHKSVHEFKAAVEGYLTHSESYSLSARAEEDLREAEKTGNYQTFNKALFGFEEALRLWSGNARAANGLAATKVAYAEAALEKHDYDLAASLLDDDNPGHTVLLAKVTRAKKERESRQRRLKVITRTAIGLVAALFIGGTVAGIWINNERAAAVEAERQAQIERDNALVAERRAAGEAVIAHFNSVEASVQRSEAVRLFEVAENRRIETEAARAQEEIQRKKAAGEAVIAHFNSVEAQIQREVANRNFRAAEVQRRRAAGEAVVAHFNSVEASVQRASAELARQDEAVQRKKAAGEAVIAHFNSVEAQIQREVANRNFRAAEVQRRRANGESVVAFFNSIEAQVQEAKALDALSTAEAARAAETIQRKRAGGEAVIAHFNSVEAQIQEAKALDALALAEQRRKQAVDAQAAEAIQRKRAAGEAMIAHFNSVEAQVQEAKAVTLFQIAERARKDEAIQRKKAAGEAVIAHFNSVEAQVQEAEAQRQRILAVAAKEAQELEAYTALIGLASAKIDENAYDFARLLLDQTPARLRNWEWGYLMHLCNQSVREFNEGRRIESVAIFSDGSRFAVAGADGLTRIHERSQEKPLQTLNYPPGVDAFAVAVSPDGNLLAIGTNDIDGGFIKLWDINAQQFVNRNFGPQNIRQVAGGNYEEARQLGHVDSVVSVEFSRDGRRLLTSSLDRTARLWNVETGEQIQAFEEHSDWVLDAGFCPNGDQPETQIVTTSEDGTAIVWQDPTGNWTDDANVSFLLPFRGHGTSVATATFSPDGQYVATGGHDGRVLVWRPQDIPQLTRQQYFTLLFQQKPVPPTKYIALVGHSGPVTSVNFAPAEASTRELTLVSGSNDHTVRIWRIPTGTEVAEVQPQRIFKGHGGWVRDCRFGPDGRWILSAGHDGFVRQWSRDDDAKSEVYLVLNPELNGHTEAVEDVAFSYEDGEKRIATVSRDKTVKVWRLENQRTSDEPIETLVEGHSSDASLPSAGFAPGGKTLVSAASDGTTRVWDVLSGTQELALEGTGDGSALAVSPRSGRWIITGRSRSTIENDPQTAQARAAAEKAKNEPWQAMLWDSVSDADPPQPLVVFGNHPTKITAAAISHEADSDGRLTLLTADEAGRCLFWKWEPGTDRVEQVRQIDALEGKKAHNGTVVAATFLPQDDIAVTAGADGSVSMWNVRTGRELTNRRLTHPAAVTSMSLSPDGRHIATACGDSRVRLWDVQSSRLLRTYSPQGRMATLLSNVKQQFNAKREPNSVQDRAWQIIEPTADIAQFRKQSGWDQGVIALINRLPRTVTQTEEPAVELAGKLATSVFDGVTAEQLLQPNIASVAVSPDGRYVAATVPQDSAVHLWQVESSTAQDARADYVLDAEGRLVQAVVFSPEAGTPKFVVLGQSDARLWLLETAQGELEPRLKISFNPHNQIVSADFEPQGRRLVTSGLERSARVWDTESGRTLVKLDGAHSGTVNQARFSPDGSRILTVSADRTAKLWKIETVTIRDPRTGQDVETQQAQVVQQFRGHQGDVMDGEFSPDGQRIVTVSLDRTLRLWDTATGKELARTPAQPGALTCVDFCGDGLRVLTGSDNRSATVWQIDTDPQGGVQIARVMDLSGHSAAITDVAFSPLEDLNGNGRQDEGEHYGSRMMTASDDNSVILWDNRVPLTNGNETPQGKQILTLRRHTAEVSSVRFSPDGQLVMTGGQDARAILWPTVDWKQAKFDALEEQKRRDEAEKQGSLTAASAR